MWVRAAVGRPAVKVAGTQALSALFHPLVSTQSPLLCMAVFALYYLHLTNPCLLHLACSWPPLFSLPLAHSPLTWMENWPMCEWVAHLKNKCFASVSLILNAKSGKVCDMQCLDAFFERAIPLLESFLQWCVSPFIIAIIAWVQLDNPFLADQIEQRIVCGCHPLLCLSLH